MYPMPTQRPSGGMMVEPLEPRQYLSFLCCKTLQDVTSGRNVQGIMVVGRGSHLQLLFKRSWRDTGFFMYWCPFCGFKYQKRKLKGKQ